MNKLFINNLIKNRGGLHNRVTHKIPLKPFTLKECREYFQARGFRLGVTAEVFSWFSKAKDNPEEDGAHLEDKKKDKQRGAQIDMLIDRAERTLGRRAEGSAAGRAVRIRFLG